MSVPVNCNFAQKSFPKRQLTVYNAENFFTETALTPEQKVEKWFPRWEINRHGEG